MSRSTQYIGLNDYAKEWVKKAVKTDTYEMTTGMFEEPVLGRIYTMPTEKYGNAIVAKEVVQASPWSSGMMIFTHLELTLVRESGEEEGFDTAFSWMADPSVASQEYDRTTGRFYL